MDASEGYVGINGVDRDHEQDAHDVALQHWMPVGGEMVVDAKERQWQRQHDEE